MARQILREFGTPMGYTPVDTTMSDLVLMTVDSVLYDLNKEDEGGGGGRSSKVEL